MSDGPLVYPAAFVRLDPAVSVRVCLTIVHFLWQGAAVALLVGIAWPLLRRTSAVSRYRVLLAALFVMAACPVVTFALMRDPPTAAPAAVVATAADASPVPAAARPSVYARTP